MPPIPLLVPSSAAGALPDNLAALPEPSEALAGSCIAVGHPQSAAIYRCNFDARSGRGSWSFVYQAEGQALAQLIRKPRVYVASRASLPELPAMWRQLRDEGADTTSSWIDIQDEGAQDYAELWSSIEAQIRASDRLVLYARAEDFPLKGALVEVGMALGAGKPVLVVLDSVVPDPESFRPVGSWMRHPGVRIVTYLQRAVHAWDVPCA